MADRRGFLAHRGCTEKDNETRALSGRGS